MARSGRRLAALSALVVLLGAGGAPAVADPDTGGGTRATDPVVSPTPQQQSRIGSDVVVPGRVDIVADDTTDAAALTSLQKLLARHDVTTVRTVTADAPRRAPLAVHLGPATRPDVAAALRDTTVPDAAEGYGLRVDATGHALGTVALGGTDAAGQYYAVQTLRQLIRSTGDGTRLAGLSITDHPAMPLRGTIEGFYGSPWTHAERLDQLAFYGDAKLNTYIYAPKDDPYHRDRWREPYPAEDLARLAELVERADAHHVRFTFALSPGTSICYSSERDRAALTGKLGAVYDIGIRSFSIPLDDISYTRWNCDADRDTYGEPGRAAAAAAQTELLNDVQRQFVETHDGVQPLQTVPTEYGDLTDTDYKRGLREHLDPAVVVMWTGPDVVPASIDVDQAEQASALFGRDVFLWDNYPVNDFGQSAGRLLLAPYDKREPGLSGTLSGIVSNPMNQAAASKLALFTIADFAWNDHAYDRERSLARAADYLAAGDPDGVRALLTFVDLNHLAPTFGSQPWQEQAPELRRDLDDVWAAYDGGDADAVPMLRRIADGIADAPATIRATVADQGFLADAANWLDATELWGRALRESAHVLAAIAADDGAGAAEARERMRSAADEAAAIRSVPGENRVEGPVRIGDGVLDAFLERVEAEHDEYLGLPPLHNAALHGEASQVSDWAPAYSADKAVDGELGNFSTTSGGEAQPWWQVDLGDAAAIERIELYNRVDCCAERVRDYHVLVSEKPLPDTLAAALSDPDVTSRHETEQAGRPTTVDLATTGRYVRVWLATTDPTELNLAEVRVLAR
ncbi:hyaluronidase [Saccharomonospora piscinae]|uniref:beta-N-acetylglucosaminidase domain-containing protein n=1 Tax=Saccharomonospora piscinae TaxID=687388 RepID=UPI001106F78B|nr:beta-N-acetylglucosaminidase domain-containing protein [Saccharomonospora piscinae]TLW94488.1 hyaluronidase [Saccharomonospora piscinae]